MGRKNAQKQIANPLNLMFAIERRIFVIAAYLAMMRSMPRSSMA